MKAPGMILGQASRLLVCLRPMVGDCKGLRACFTGIMSRNLIKLLYWGNPTNYHIYTHTHYGNLFKVP